MSEKVERGIVAAAAAVLVFCMVAFGVHQFIELNNLDNGNYGIVNE